MSPRTTASNFPSAAASSASGPSVVTLRRRNPVEVADAYARDLDQPVRTISCDECFMVNTTACDDCVMTFLLSLSREDVQADPGGALGGAMVGSRRRVKISTEEFDTLSLLQQSGLAPASNFAVRPVSLASRRADLVSAR